MIPMDRKSPVDPHIGQRLKEYRQHRGMTVRQLADAAHVTPGQISRYEHGRDRISHERVTEFARILRIKSNDLYQPPGSRLRRNHVRWRLTNFMAAVIAEAAALMSSRRKAAADNEATMVAAVAVAVSTSAAAASDAGVGEKSSLTTSADDTAVDISGSLSGAALKFNPIWHRMAETVTEGRGSKVAYDPPMSAAGEQASAQSTSAENGFIVSNPFPFTETASGNKDHSAFQFKPSMDHHAVNDPEINDITKEHPEHPAPHIGQRLKEYRQHRGMTVRQLADAAHVTPGQISHYEHGRIRISHERVTEFARILRIKANDLYQPPGSRLRRNHVRWRLTNFMAAVIAEAAALISSRRKAAADNEATMVAAVAVAVGAAAAASDAGAGEKSSLTTSSADDTAVDISGSLSGAALKFNPIWHRMAETVTEGRGSKVAYDPPMSAAGEQASAQSTSAENGFIVSNPFPFTETASGNKDHSAFQFKPSMDHHAVNDPEINDITKEHPEHPAPHTGQRLKEYRQHRGMTVRQLADAAHVTPGQISHYEHGRIRISHERVTEFARILRIKANDLYQPPGSRLRGNHVRWRLTKFMAAVIAEAAA